MCKQSVFKRHFTTIVIRAQGRHLREQPAMIQQDHCTNIDFHKMISNYKKNTLHFFNPRESFISIQDSTVGSLAHSINKFRFKVNILRW